MMQAEASTSPRVQGLESGIYQAVAGLCKLLFTEFQTTKLSRRTPARWGMEPTSPVAACLDASLPCA